MLGRILLITFQQAMRSVVLTLFPIGFISLLAWATAGSATGNTSDPIRAALWLWLAAHMVPFHLSLAPSFTSGALTYLPLAAAIFPVLAIRSGFKRSAAFLGNVRAARSFIIIWYLLFATIAAALSQSSGIKPVLYLAPIYAGLLALGATVESSLPVFTNSKFLIQIFGVFLGVALVLDAAAMAAHFKVVHDLAIVIQPGWVGGVLFLAIQLLYLPNIAIASLSYLFGIGFSIGAATQISPFNFDLTALPAIPALGALPTGKHPLVIISLLALLLATLLHQLKSRSSTLSLLTNSKVIFSQAVPAALLLAGISFLSGGELITKDMNPVGVSWWSLPSVFLGAEILTAILVLYLPALVKSLSRKRTNI
jgi:hypothetical protein